MKITVKTIVSADIEDVWKSWNTPEDIKKWNTASPEWLTTKSRVDLREGGTFSSRMESMDGSMGFDFSGTYTKIEENRRIEYSLDDGRNVVVTFTPAPGGVEVTEVFDADTVMSPEQQKEGWQNILDNFARYTQSK